MPNSNDDHDAWIFESPDNGKTVTKRKRGSPRKYRVWETKTDWNDPDIQHSLGIDIIQRIKYIAKQEQK
jgi:hypothetical protein